MSLMSKATWLLLVFVAISIIVQSEPRRRSGRRRNSKFDSVKATNVTQATQDGRKGRFFSIFNIVQFRNLPCQSNAGVTGSGNQRNGTCYTTQECQDRGGAASGNCASGFGTCCVFVNNNANRQIVENCTYIQNPSFPAGDTASNGITFTVGKCSNDVCYLRLDFESFTLQGVGGTDLVDEGVCTDMFVVTTPTTQTMPTICGFNTGYHIYVDIGANSGDTATLAFTFQGTGTSRIWDIKVTQVECSNPTAPPDTCLQYHTGITGRIETFNYQATNDNHLNNQCYNACIRAECGFCCVQYSQCRDQGTLVAMSLDVMLTMAMTDEVCSTVDYILIPDSSGTCNCASQGATRAVNSRYCGPILSPIMTAEDVTPETLPGTICDCTPPFMVGIFTNNVADPSDTPGDTAKVNSKHSKGLCLEYTQIPC